MYRYFGKLVAEERWSLREVVTNRGLTNNNFNLSNILYATISIHKLPPASPNTMA